MSIATRIRDALRIEPRLEVRARGATEALSQGVALNSFRYGQWSQPINLQQASREGIRASAVVYRCAMAVASAAASLDVAVQTAGAEEYDFAGVVPVLFNKRPNPMWTAAAYKLLYWLQLELVGQHFSYMDRGPTGEAEPTEIWPLFDPVEIVIDDRTDPLRPQLLGFRVLHNQGALGLVNGAAGGTTALLPSEVLWLRLPDPADPWGCLPPLRAAAWAADLDNYARQWQAGEFRNGATPPGVVYLGDVGDQQYGQIVAGFEARQTGPMNARRMMFTSGPIKPEFVRLGLTSVEMSYLQSREHNATDIMRAFGVSKDLLDGAATYANRREAKIHLWTETILPQLQIVESEIDRQLLPEDRQRALFDTRRVDALKENADSISARASTEFKTGYILLDEAREKVGYPPLPGGAGQKLFVPRGAQNAQEAEIGALGPPGEGADAANEDLGQQPSDAVRHLSDAAGQLVGGSLVPLSALIPPERRARRQAQPLDRATIQRAYDRYAASGQRAVRRLAEKQRAVVLRNVQRRSKRGELEQRAEDDVFDEPYWRDVTAETLQEWLTQVYEAGGDRTASSLATTYDGFTEKVLQRMRDRLDYLAGRVTTTTAEAIRQALLEPGVAEGEDVPDLASRLTAVFDDLSSSRAETIARTETVSGFNAASREVAAASDVVTGKRWLAAGDDRVRDSHEAMDGEEVGIDEPYSNGLMFPGDPTGDPEEVINCRCVEEYVLADETDAGDGEGERMRRLEVRQEGAPAGVITDASGMNRSPLITDLHVHVHEGDHHHQHDIHVAEGAVNAQSHHHHRVDARTTVHPADVKVEAPKQSKKVTVKGPDGKTMTLERSDG